ncbi:MAG: hypothetical protein DWQ04_18135 [Chloroflexi bacterium]|nr:MAG: hypothetical protein DWQ04_18135 [Chloroflexota bacterium]
MTESKPTQTRWRILYTLAPLLLLIICLVGINLLNGWYQQTILKNDGGVETAVLDQQPNQPTAIAPPTLAQTLTTPLPTIIPTPSATPYILPTLPSEAQIQLLGPPEDSVFSKNQSLSFYWEWPLPLTEDQSFTVTLLVDDQLYDFGSVIEPNLGLSYRWQLSPASIPNPTETIQWQIQLFSQNSDTPLIVSERRTFSLR